MIDIIKELKISIKNFRNGNIVIPKIIDIHPVNGRCNLKCVWCIGKKGYKKIKPLTDNFSIENIDIIIQNILNPNYKDLWPLEFHICGCDSEPLIKSKEVCYLINKLKKKNRIVELITNGLLVDNKNIETLLTLDKLSISLDVVSDIDFYSFKINGASKILDGYTKCIENIKKIAILRRVLNSKTSIYVTFIATSQNFDFEKWKNTFIELKKLE